MSCLTCLVQIDCSFYLFGLWLAGPSCGLSLLCAFGDTATQTKLSSLLLLHIKGLLVARILSGLSYGSPWAMC